LETTALDPQQGRIFLVAIRDSRGWTEILEAPTAADEATLIKDLCTCIRQRDPDVIENNNLFLRPESRIVEVVRGLFQVHATLVSVQTSSHLSRAAPVTGRYDS
jgi:hypothetical protein